MSLDRWQRVNTAIYWHVVPSLIIDGVHERADLSIVDTLVKGHRAHGRALVRRFAGRSLMSTWATWALKPSCLLLSVVLVCATALLADSRRLSAQRVDEPKLDCSHVRARLATPLVNCRRAPVQVMEPHASYATRVTMTSNRKEELSATTCRRWGIE